MPVTATNKFVATFTPLCGAVNETLVFVKADNLATTVPVAELASYTIAVAVSLPPVRPSPKNLCG